NGQMPALRLVALVGMLSRLDIASGADKGLTELPLCVAVGVLAGFAQNQTVRASGDFFGTCWDGPTFFARTEENRHGPFLEHPIFTVNEFKPGPWEFEMGTPGRRVAWIRVALDLFEDHSQNGDARPVNLPHGRRAA